jgi:gas vesicle protein/FtsZ-binding cell division protein ZapB
METAMAHNCPLCGAANMPMTLNIQNVQFLAERAAEATLDECITMARIAWNNFPSLKLEAGSKELITEILKALQEQVNATLSPINQLSQTIMPLVDKLGGLTSKLPEDIRKEFSETNKQLSEQLKAFKEATDKSSQPVQQEIKSLSTTLAELIHKPIAKGTVAERTFGESWQEAFTKDQVKLIGGPGQPDLLVTPYLTFNGVRQGKKISLERKTGSQRYTAEHVIKGIEHAKLHGAPYCIIVYDTPENLTEQLRPIHVEVEDGIVTAVADFVTGGWKTVRQTFEVLQSLIPSNTPTTPETIDVPAIQRTVEEMQKLTATIESLRKHNNCALKNCDKAREDIAELEQGIIDYQQRLKELLSKKSSKK